MCYSMRETDSHAREIVAKVDSVMFFEFAALGGYMYVGCIKYMFYK